MLLNDKEPLVVIKNVLTFLLLQVEDCDLAADVILHIWYAKNLLEQHIQLLESTVMPTILGVAEKSSSRKSHFLAKTTRVGKGTLRIILSRDQWLFAAKLLTSSRDVAKAQKSYESVMLTRQDYIDRRLFTIRNALHARVSLMHFRQDGTLLPFGATSQQFVVPNP